VTKPAVATIETRSLRQALAERDELAGMAVEHAIDAAAGLPAHPSLGRCAGCASPWTEDLGPLALVEAVLDGQRAVGLLCEACAHGEDVPATLERILRAMLPGGSRVVDKRLVRVQPAGHA
jgi:hypothetical protein